ncbi:MAG: beta-ketoacyl-[acyl-carrier-protein] synthase family protein [Deltaproteobacteria bacterium]|jgi:3-oxoacyl-[acyl-carrier-protein] synthase-1|nr:beta-ketoacyl-[acyl-carrier-protein] synthase family protein [Deltaproteobacteria bacterium]
MRRVVVVGVGLVSVLGTKREQVADALYRGRSGVVSDPSRLTQGFRSSLTGHIADFDPSRHLTRKQRKSMPDFAVQAHAALMDALEHAGLEADDLRSERCGMIFSNDSTVLPVLEQQEALLAAGQTVGMGSGHIFRCMNSTITMNLNVLLGNMGASWTVSAACAGGAYAIGQAADCIRLGRQDRMLCGGAQELNPQAVCSFDGLGAFSVRSPAEDASRPFDKDRDGLVPSGGAAALVLEDYETARKRGARVCAEILGFGCGADGEALSLPSHAGLARAMRMALREAGLNTADIDLINAHATSTPAGDAAEAANLLSVFGSACPPVMALKSLTGHELWMSGASQVAYAVLMAERGFTAGTRNYTAPDESTAGVPVLAGALDVPPRVMLCNAAGFGGSNACLALRL